MAVQHGTLGVWMNRRLSQNTAAPLLGDALYKDFIDDVQATAGGNTGNVSSRVDFTTLSIQRHLGDQLSRCSFDMVLADSDTVPAIGDVVLVAERNIASWTPTAALELNNNGADRVDYTLSASIGGRDQWVGYTAGMKFVISADTYYILARVMSNDGSLELVTGNEGSLGANPTSGTQQLHYVLFGGLVSNVRETGVVYGRASTNPLEDVRVKVECVDWTAELNAALDTASGATNIRTILDKVTTREKMYAVYNRTVWDMSTPALTFAWVPLGEMLRATVVRNGLQYVYGGDRSVHTFSRYTYAAPITVVEDGSAHEEHSTPLFVQDYSNLYNAIVAFSSAGTSTYLEVVNQESIDTYGRREARLADSGSSRPNVALEASALVQEFSTPHTIMTCRTTSAAAQRLEPGQLISCRSTRRAINRPFFLQAVTQRCLGYDTSLGRYVWHAELEASDLFGGPATPDQILARLIREADDPDASALATRDTAQRGDFENARLTPSISIVVT